MYRHQQQAQQHGAAPAAAAPAVPASTRADILRAVDGFVVSLPLGTSPGARTCPVRLPVELSQLRAVPSCHFP